MSFLSTTNIRKVKRDYGLSFPDMAFEQIKLHIKTTQESFSFKSSHGQILIDLDNQEYIILLLEECAKKFSKYKDNKEYIQKAIWYRNAAKEAQNRKEQYAKQLEETRIKAELEKEKQDFMSGIYITIGLFLIVIFIIFFFAFYYRCYCRYFLIIF